MRRSRRTAHLTPSASTCERRDPAPQRMDLRHRLEIDRRRIVAGPQLMESQLESPTRSRTTRSVSRSFASASGALFSSTAGSWGSRALSRIAHRPAADSRDVMVGSGDRIRYRLRVGLHLARSFRRAYGVSPREDRKSAASGLRLGGPKAISDLSLECGFGSPPHFVMLTSESSVALLARNLNV